MSYLLLFIFLQIILETFSKELLVELKALLLELSVMHY